MESERTNESKWKLLKPSAPLLVWVFLATLTVTSGLLVHFLFSSADISDLKISRTETKRTYITDSIQIYELHGSWKLEIDDEIITLPEDFEDKVFLISKKEENFINENIRVKSTISLTSDRGAIIQEEIREETDLNSLQQLSKFRWIYVILPKIIGAVVFLLCLIFAFLTFLTFCAWIDDRKSR